MTKMIDEMTIQEYLQWIIDNTPEGFGHSGLSHFMYELKNGAEFYLKTIAEHEARQWKKYPKNTPKNDFYLIVMDYNSNLYTHGSLFIAQFILTEGWYLNFRKVTKDVIAFRELPESYKEGGEG